MIPWQFLPRALVSRRVEGRARGLSLLLMVSLLGCQARVAETPMPQSPTEPVENLGSIFETAQNSGLDFEYRNGMSGALYLPEVMGGGGAWIDFDNDGDLDLYLVQGHHLGPGSPPPESQTPDGLHDRLYRNDLDQGSLHFTDVTAESGLTLTSGYGMGVAVGDVDNDGLNDLYVTNLGSNQLWRNNGMGADGVVTFTDITTESGTDDPRWSTSAAFVDIDHDGWLDLYVTNYVDFDVASHKQCVNEAGVPDYCGPRSYQPETDRLWRNEGLDRDGTIRFTDISTASGLLEAAGPGLGVVTADLDGDGFVDVYVANDQARNHLWLNQGGNGRLQEVGLQTGSALDGRGRAQASMGIDAGDVDSDGDLDLFMTHLIREVNTLYLNDGTGLFADRSTAAGVGPPSIAYTGFGTALLDVDNDGDLDAVAVNGEVRHVPKQRDAGDSFPLRQPNQLFLNEGGHDPLFTDASHRVPAFAEPLVSRGAIAGDVDNDGDTDLLVTNIEDGVQLLLNQVGQEAPWIGLQLLGVGGRPMLGARVTLQPEGQRPRIGQARTDGGYLTARDSRVLFGLGSDRAADIRSEALVRWPSGRCERWKDLESGRYHTLTEGEGATSEC